MTTSFWLASVDQYGTGRLIDGPHVTREGVEQARYLHERLGLAEGELACAEVILTPVEAKPHGANEEALKTLNSVGFR